MDYNMEPPSACEIDRLPEELLVHVISLTSPADAFRAAAVSRAFHAAADSDTVWSCFVPPDLPRFAKKQELPRKPPPTKKGMFRRLSEEPVLLPHKLIRMQLDKATGAKCLTLSACALLNQFTRRWVRVGSAFDYSKKGDRFSDAADLGYMQLEIRGKVQRKMLSRNTTYAAYMVFKLADRFYGFEFPFQEASIGVPGSESVVRKVCLQGYVEDGGGADDPPRRHVLPSYYPNHDAVSPGEDVHFPRRKAGGWMEVELGEFHNGGEGDDGEVSFSLVEKTSNKCGLIVWGIEFRCR